MEPELAGSSYTGKTEANQAGVLMDWIWREKEKVKGGTDLPSNGQFPFLATVQEKFCRGKLFLDCLFYVCMDVCILLLLFFFFRIVLSVLVRRVLE